MAGRCSIPLARGGPLTLLLLVAVSAPVNVAGQEGSWNPTEVLRAEDYQRPPQTIVDAALAPRWLNVSLTSPSPDRRWFLNEIGDGPVKMDLFSRPFHDLGGEFIDFRANRDRNLTIRNSAGLEVISAEDGSRTPVDVPRGARISDATFSPDGSRIAFFAHFDDATHIFVADPETGDSRQVTRRPVLATLVTSFEWTENGRIGTVLVPDDRPPMPVAPEEPTGPQVKITEDGENRLRTYASLMATPYDEALLEWDVTGQLALIDVQNRRVTEIGAPTMVRSFDFSPTGEYVRVTRMVKPFSYVVPVGNFGRIEEIWDLDGNVLAALDTTELNTGIRDDDQPGFGGRGGGDTQQGRRALTWRDDGQGLSYLEQEPAPEGEDTTATAAGARSGRAGGGAGGRAGTGRGGGPQERARRPDRVMQWLPPFDDDSKQVVYESDSRIQSVSYSEDYQTLFLTERQGTTTHQYAVFLSDPETPHTIYRWNSDDFYDNPGSLVGGDGRVSGGGRGGFGGFGRGGGGGGTVLTTGDGSSVFLAGTIYDEDPQEVGPTTFIDKVDLRSGDKERIFEGDNDGVYERATAILDTEGEDLIVSHESPTEVEQFYRVRNGTRTQLTENRDYTPDLTSAVREHFVVERPDGFRFRVNVTLPPAYREGTRLPAMFWFYPREYEDQEDYDEGARTYNKNAFPGFSTRSMEYLVRLGYAVVEPDAPIVGEAGQENNHYEYDLRNNLAAVIDELDRRQIIDRQRLAIGGHSYGAFSTVNAMVHTPFFKAGIAGDGNYNRTLTPLAFQNERRYLWDARDVYLSMSPFLYADQLTGALLMYHGLHDQNVGTDPTHSPRLFHALNGLGKTAAMYLYPLEDHGPASLETQLDLWARWTAWLDIYVKNAGRDETVISEEQGGASH